MAILGEPIKKQYLLEGYIPAKLIQTGETAISFSIICDMGQAIPDPKKETWYLNAPVPGLKLELRARAILKLHDNTYNPLGFVVITKNGETLKVFKPLGDYVKGQWDGDAFNSWSGTDTDIRVFSEYSGKSGHAYFDLMDGNGFYFKSNKRDDPDYFLSKCRKIKKTGLPVYTIDLEN